LSEAVMNRHAVYGALMAETTFKIVEVLGGQTGARVGEMSHAPSPQAFR
jgi:hypothetical protein